MTSILRAFASVLVRLMELAALNTVKFPVLLLLTHHCSLPI